MTALPELVRLFAELASHLRRPAASAASAACADDVRPRLGGEASMAIATLAASLNSDERGARAARVLDTALSLMCFNTSEVCSARIECLVGTIISVLSSSISCSASQIPNRVKSIAAADLLSVGSSISPRDCGVLIRVCADVLETVEGHCAAGLFHSLLYAVVKAAIMSSINQSLCCDENEEIRCSVSKTVPRLTRFIPNQAFCTDHDFPLRLFFWYLDPLILKHDVSEMLQEVMRRPFLCLSKELHDQMHWRQIIICLVTSPTIFIETRALLHGWFLVMGSSSIMDLKIGIVSAVLDILCRPVSWNITMELGLKYPSCYAYYSSKHHNLLKVLTGPVSCKTFLHLVCYLKAQVSPSASAETASLASHTSTPSRNNAIHNVIDSDSIWAMLMEFPTWFYVSAALLFYGSSSEDYMWNIISNELKSEAINNIELHEAAAHYLSWILSPFYEADFDIILEHIRESSKCLSLTTKADRTCEEMFISGLQPKNSISRSKKLRISKGKDLEKLHRAAGDDRSFLVGVWLQKLNDLHIRLSTRATSNNMQPGLTMTQNTNIHPNYLFLRITLGMLIMYPSYWDSSGCHLLLHYAATGEIIELKEVQKEIMSDFDADNLAAWSEYDASQWALNGARLVFDLLDIAEDMSVMLFNIEDNQADFVCQIKGKVTSYLITCLEMLLRCQDFCSDARKLRDTMLDLHHRLAKWKLQGREAFEGDEAFNDFVDAFAGKLPAFLTSV